VTLQNGIDAAAFQPPGGPAASRRVTFCGVLNYPPNEEAVIWFATRVWPRVRARFDDARFSIVGSHPTAAVQRLAADPTIEVTGAVPATQPYLWDSAIAVAPIFVARGVQNKVLEAVAAGLPCVVTPAVATGVPPAVMRACRVGTDPDTFADAVVTLLALAPADRRAIADRADLQSLRWEDQLAPLTEILHAAVASAASAAPISAIKRRFARSF
jgi:polysaccharide biosynthesis protein PslH